MIRTHPALLKSMHSPWLGLMPTSSFLGLFTRQRRTKEFWLILGLLVFVTVPVFAKKPTVTVNLFDYRGFSSTPVPGYPKQALDKNWGGIGLFQLNFDHGGSVTKVEMMISTDHQLLDQAAMAELNQWKCQPHALSSAVISVSFKANRSHEALDLREDPGGKKKRNMVFAPHPNYPLAARRLRATGKGLFMLHFRPDGGCDKAVPIEWMGSYGGIFGSECVSTFLNWRCFPGVYTVVIVPISFTMNGRGGF